MRPPLNAGENVPACLASVPCARPFNEAPAERGGKPSGPGTPTRRRRPFNEAPAERGGKPGQPLTFPGSPALLQ